MKPLILTKFLLFTLLFSFQGWSQNASTPKVVVEQIQAYSYLNPTASYWKIPANISPILETLDSSLFVTLKMQRDKDYTTTTNALTKLNQTGKIKIDWSNSLTIPYHAYIEIYEMDPEFAYKNDLVNLSETAKDSIHSVWFIACSIFNLKKERVFQKTIMLGFTPVESLGLGYTIKSTPSMPNLLYNAIAKSMNYLDAEGDEIDFINVKVPAAYATDNYWMPFVHNMPRILFDTTKKFISFEDNAGVHALRMPPAVLKKINNKDKSETNPYKNLVELLRKTRPQFNRNEYYQVMQPLRDIKNNIDYTLESYIEFNSEPVFNDNTPRLAIQFLPEVIHRIFQDKDSIGYFTVKDFVKEENKFYYPDLVYNGYDSSHSANLGTFFAKQPITHSRVISGKSMNHDFVIQLNYENNITTILIDKQMVMAISGNKKPLQMVEKRNNLPTIENLLLLIAYAEIFQQPG
ncbi:MAG: hypothetical protein RI982_1216 [Bacteroidota bacterium]|jgi:hypothetical protein